MVTKKKVVFSWKIWLKKFLKHSLYVIIAGVAVVYADNPMYMAIAPALKGIENIISNY